MTQLNMFTKPYVEAMAKYNPVFGEMLNGWDIDEDEVKKVFTAMPVEDIEKMADDKTLNELTECMREPAPQRSCGCGCAHH